MSELNNWCTLPTSMGNFRMYDTGNEDVRLISMGDVDALGEQPLLRIHSSCLASEVFGANDCDCADQLRESMKLIANEGEGIIIHLHQEGRGQGLSKKIRAVRLMESDDFDTVEAFEHLGLEQDIRNYDSAVAILKSLGVIAVRLISNNPRKRAFLHVNDIEVSSVSTHPNIRPENEVYLYTKNQKLGHQIPLEMSLFESDEIRFYHSDQPWGEFSNFSPHSIFIDGITWLTVEHYYQAQKFIDIELKEKIRLSKTPTLAKITATEMKNRRRDDWAEMKEGVMLKALRGKFAQHPELAKLLLSTSQKRLVESTSNDTFWGESLDSIGQNRLGESLMLVRTELDK
jgi:GTP cyclohydrolase II